jgi:CubicO group peptidase (beta-lactamase class C family)
MFIGSQTKSFTALAIMQLVEAGKIVLDAPLQRYIPWFKVADPQASASITVRSLLNHSSGLSEAGYIPHLPSNATLEQAVRDLQRARPTAPLGTKFQYFNPGYITLGYLVETISGQSYAEYLRQRVFEPLGMHHTSANLSEFPGMDIAQGYTQLFGFPVPMPQPVPAYYLPAGFIVSTAEDLGRYLVAMNSGGELNGQRILSQASIAQMLTPDPESGSLAGFGWDITQYYGEKQITHGGANETFNTHVLILPQSGLTVTMLLNQDHMFKATYDYEALFWGVIGLLTGHPVPKQQVSGVILGYGTLVVFLAVLFFSVRGLIGLPKARQRLRKKSVGQRWLSLLPHGIFILVTLIAVLVIGPSLAGRGFDLRWFTGFYPDVAILAGTVLIAESIQALVKGIFIWRG